jgi:ADP-ribosylation factor-like protein 13
MSVTFALDVIMEEGECSRKIGAPTISKPCSSQCYDTKTPDPSVDVSLFKGNTESSITEKQSYIDLPLYFLQ